MRRTETVKHRESQLDPLPSKPAVVRSASIKQVERLENNTPNAFGIKLRVDPRDRIANDPQVPPHLGEEQVLLVFLAFERELPIMVLLVRHLLYRALQ